MSGRRFGEARRHTAPAGTLDPKVIAARCSQVATSMKDVAAETGVGFVLFMFAFGEAPGFACRTNVADERAKEAAAQWLLDGLVEPAEPPPSPELVVAFRASMRQTKAEIERLCLPGTGFAYILFQPEKTGNISLLTNAGSSCLRELFEQWLRPGAMVTVDLAQEGSA